MFAFSSPRAVPRHPLLYHLAGRGVPETRNRPRSWTHTVMGAMPAGVARHGEEEAPTSYASIAAPGYKLTCTRGLGWRVQLSGGFERAERIAAAAKFRWAATGFFKIFVARKPRQREKSPPEASQRPLRESSRASARPLYERWAANWQRGSPNA